MNNVNEAIPPVSSTSPALSYQTTDLEEIHRLNRIIDHMYSQQEMDDMRNQVIEYMYSQAEMDEVQAIITRLQETEYRLRVEIQRLKNIS